MARDQAQSVGEFQRLVQDAVDRRYGQRRDTPCSGGWMAWIRELYDDRVIVEADGGTLYEHTFTVNDDKYVLSDDRREVHIAYRSEDTEATFEAAATQAELVACGEWDEHEHPRHDDGRFAPKGGGSDEAPTPRTDPVPGGGSAEAPTVRTEPTWVARQLRTGSLAKLIRSRHESGEYGDDYKSLTALFDRLTPANLAEIVNDDAVIDAAREDADNGGSGLDLLKRARSVLRQQRARGRVFDASYKGDVVSAVLGVAERVACGEWDEHEHPRHDDGRFAPKGGGSDEAPTPRTDPVPGGGSAEAPTVRTEPTWVARQLRTGSLAKLIRSRHESGEYGDDYKSLTALFDRLTPANLAEIVNDDAVIDAAREDADNGGSGLDLLKRARSVLRQQRARGRVFDASYKGDVVSAVLGVAERVACGEWDESKHPRDDDGKFASKPGGGKTASSAGGGGSGAGVLARTKHGKPITAGQRVKHTTQGWVGKVLGPAEVPKRSAMPGLNEPEAYRGRVLVEHPDGYKVATAPERLVHADERSAAVDLDEALTAIADEYENAGGDGTDAEHFRSGIDQLSRAVQELEDATADEKPAKQAKIRKLSESILYDLEGARMKPSMMGRIRALLDQFDPSSTKKHERLRVAAIKASDIEKQIAYAEVYAPGVIDTHGEYMTADDIREMAHRFMASKRGDRIDVMHDNRGGRAYTVESFIAQKGDPRGFTEDAWVLGVKVTDRGLWQAIKKGDINSLSFQASVIKVPEVFDGDFATQFSGLTGPPRGVTKSQDHEHEFAVELDERGNVLRGQTSKAADGHWHEITENVRTGITDGHRHTFDLRGAVLRAA